jgi:hypothetical protein
MNSNARLSIRILLSAISIALIGWIFVPAVNAQPNLSSPETTPSQPAPAQPQQPSETPPPPPEQPQQNSYVGFGGVIGLQGSTTSLSQGTFSVFSKHVLTNNLAIHTASTIFGSLTPSASAALTFNKPINSDSLPIVFTLFIGAGIMADYENGTRISPHITGGVDIGTPTNVSATLRINTGFVKDRKADVGILFGIGFNY